MKKDDKIIFYDNAGENKTFKENCAIVFEETKFEFAAPDTPQQNEDVEWGLATLYY